MKTKLKLFQARLFCAVVLGIGSSFSLAAAAEDAADTAPTKTSAAIPWPQIGAKAGANYKGHGLAIVPTVEGARLRCVFQQLEGAATRDGLWLTSTVTNAVNDRFRVVATAVGRVGNAGDGASEHQCVEPALHAPHSEVPRLSDTGTVAIDGQIVRFTRPGLVEEYTVSMDGVRQDFVVRERPAGAGELRVQLAVNGARVESAAFGARFVLENSGRKVAYSRLRATDATGKELTARMEVPEKSDILPRRRMKSEVSLAVLLNDADAVYPVRIDPTFSDANWVSMGGIAGANGEVYAVAVDGSGNLYIGGSFTLVGETQANGVAEWDGSDWRALGSGIQGGGTVNALAVLGSDVYVGGYFFGAGGKSANNFAKWNGSGWSALSSGVGEIYALGVAGSDVYAGGYDGIAKWDGNSWLALGSGIGGLYHTVYALALTNGDVYAGGRFTIAGGNPANSIAKWNGTNWSALGSGLSHSLGPRVFALALSGSDLYVGGDFTGAGDRPANYIAKWDGTDWSALGSGMNDIVSALAVSGGNVYAGGRFTTAGGTATNHVAKWDGSSWKALDSGINGTVSALAVWGSHLYAAGQFATAGTSAPIRVAEWSGSRWQALGSAGMDSDVRALSVSGKDVYAAGLFTSAGGILANHIAKWDGSSWTALGSGITGGRFADSPYVLALAASGGDLFAGGHFTQAGGSPATNIAEWNGSSWSALDSGVNGNVYALSVLGSNLFVGGQFTMAGGSPATNVAKWNGSSWAPVGLGLNGGVQTLAVLDTNLYAGGQFTMAGGSPATNIAKWNGSMWSALDSGVNGTVYALAVIGGELFAGGGFTMAGGSPATNIAKWNGAGWTGLGSGTSQEVYALAVLGGDLYAGGGFSTAGGVLANGIAKWEQNTWKALGSGMGAPFPSSPSVLALAVSDSDLYAGGNFTAAGGQVSFYAGRAYLIPRLAVERSPDHLTLSWPTAFAEFALQQNADLANTNGWSNANYPFTTNRATKSATVPTTAAHQYFRLIGN